MNRLADLVTVIAEILITPFLCTSLLLLHLSSLTLDPVVMIGFAQTAYSMSEEDPSGQGNTVMVCIVLTGELDDDVEVVLTTMSGSATGDSSVLLRNIITGWG